MSCRGNRIGFMNTNGTSHGATVNPYASFSRDDQSLCTTFKRVAAWASLILGVLFVLTGMIQGFNREAASTMMLGALFIFPALWWFRCQLEDEARLKEYKEALKAQRDIEPWLTDEDRRLLGIIAAIEPPQRIKRQWPMVGMICLAILLIAPQVGGFAADQL